MRRILIYEGILSVKRLHIRYMLLVMLSWLT